MSNVSTVTPAQVIPTARTASSAAASSTANPNNNPSIITWSLPGTPVTPLVQSTQSFSTKKGEVFTDFASGQIVSTGGNIINAPQGYATQEGTPKNNS